MVVIVAIAGLALGFIVILLISLTAPREEDAPGDGDGAGRNLAHGWISRLSADQLARLLTMLFSELKYEVEDTRIGDGVVDLLAVNPTPISGGRIYIRGIAHEVRGALDTSRAEMAGKALIATGGVFSPEARAAAEGVPLELLDGATLMSLIKKHLPPIAVARRV